MPKEARMINEAVRATTKDGILTADIGGENSTKEVTDSIISHISKMYAGV
nr:isocitrate/isopropylmalate family dehydrogenase [Scopulibacillus darangshiensis]